MTLLDDLLLAARREADNPTLPGPLNSLPTPAKRALAVAFTAAMPGWRAIEPIGNKVRAAGEYGGKALTGGLYAGLGQLQTQPLLRGSESEADQRARMANDPFMQAWLAYQAQGGNIIQKARAANEGAAAGHEFETGLVNAILDPTNLIPIPVGKGGKALEATRNSKKAEQLMAGVVDAGAGDDLAALIEDAGKNLPLAPEKKDLAAYMKSLGLGKPETVGNIPSPLVPERTPNLLQLARDGNGVVETNRLNLPLDPSIGDLRTQLRNAQMPQVVGANDITAPSSLVPDKVPSLLRIAREAQGGKVPSLAAPVKGARAINARLPESIPATELDKFLRVSESVVGDLPPEGASFWARNGIPNEQVPSLFEASRKAGAMGQNADALLLDSPLLSNVDIPSRAPELPASGMGVRALNAAVDLAYGGKQQFAFPALLKRIGGRVDKTGVIWVGDRNVTNDVFEYLYASYDAKGKKAKDLLREQLMERVGAVGDVAPASTPSVAEDLATKVDEFGREYTQLPAQIDDQGNLVYPRQYGNYKGDPSGSSINFTLPGANALGQIGKAALNTPYLGTGIIGAGIGAAGGAATGAVGLGTLGALGTPEDRWGGFKQGFVQGAEGGAVLGAAIGAAGGAYGLSHLTGTSIKDLGKNSFGLALEAQKEAAKNSGKFTFTPKQLFSYWGNQTVSTARQWIQDGVWNKVVLQALQGKQATKELGTITEDIAKNLRLTGNARLSRPVQDVLALVGNPDKGLELGVPLMTEIGKRDLSMTQSMGASATLSLLGGPTNLLGAGASLVKGALMPGWSRFLHVSNGAINRAFREAALVDEMGNKLIPLGVEEFQKLGYDLSSIPVDELSAARVAQLHGVKAGAMWQQVLDNSLDMAQSRVRYLFGDYSKKGMIEQIVGTGIPFASWAIRAYPVALDMAIQHPWVALGIYQYLQATSRNAGKDGRPNYTAGMVGFSTETPVIGAGARTLLGGQKGDAYIDPVAGISPVGGNMFQPQDEANPNPSLYQQVSEVLGRAGLPGLNPLVTAVSYILGLDYRAPTNLSRTQGLENSLGLVPGNVDIPDVGGAGLRKLRGLVSPLVAGTELGQKVGAEGDANPTVFDPVARRYGELVVEQTGKTVDDPENRAYLYDLAAGTGELYDQAKREVLLSGAAKNAFSLTSPTSVVTQSASNKAGRQAKAGIPFDYTKLQALAAANIPSDIANAQQDNRAYKQGNPTSAAYDVGSRDEALSMLMQDVKDRYTFNGVTHSPTNPAEQQAVMNRLLTEARYGEQFRNLDPVDVPPWKK